MQDIHVVRFWMLQTTVFSTTAIAMALKSLRLVEVKFSYEILHTITSCLHVVSPNKSGPLGQYPFTFDNVIARQMNWDVQD